MVELAEIVEAFLKMFDFFSQILLRLQNSFEVGFGRGIGFKQINLLI